MTFNAHPFQLLEINVISGQDLAPVSKSMRTYAVVWVHPGRKLSTKIDQNGHINPQWNEKFVFRVDETFINAENSSIMIEIYAAAWLRDVQIGSVRVLISNLFPSNYNNNKMRFVALQVRRPSGRPQGILNMGVQVLDSTMRSMPLYTELSASGVGFNDLINAKTTGKTLEEKSANLRRTKSDRTDPTTTDESGLREGGVRSLGGSLINSSVVKPSVKENGNGSIVNGSLCSDVGPSASVVAAAIAKGLIKPPANAGQHDTDGAGSSILEDWTENDSAEGLRTKLERWRTELPPIYDNDLRKMQSRGRHRKQRRRPEGGRLFSCFGNAFGCEISITCGGRNNKKRYGNHKVCHLSSVDSQSYL
ncbi:INGRESSION PROTEIN FIC1 [Salix purpurea]|uniref:INGRESSION PROTEIN FIC1 n=1 Tax=Salix purpurea TaxID=77065 RepID=A0A9Q0V8V7_SALPP|nr:INGRESSION PROTEIN FIC1 [Salix purpurea]